MQLFLAAKNLICSKHGAVIYPHEHLSAELVGGVQPFSAEGFPRGSPDRSLSPVLSGRHILCNH